METTTNELLRCYNKPVPRYTSYPTAPHFRHALTNADMDYMLASQKRDAPFSLYLHVPFCRALCNYCGCFTRVVNHQAPVKDYVGLLVKEIRLAGESAGYRPPVSHVHFGGGSPNLLDKEDIGAIFSALEESFAILDTAELAMEMDPRILTPEKAKSFAEAGINRVSLGVQDFQKDVQEAVNRIQPYDKVADCVDWLRDAGIDKINFDLMYGLPRQTVDGIRDNIEKALSLEPDRLALFGYAHVPWMRPHQKKLEAFNLPGEEERLIQFNTAYRELGKNGYQPVGMDHFARPDDPLCRAVEARTLRRNFQGYTTDTAEVLVGFGLSSISRFPDAYIQNTNSIKAYREALSQKQFPVAKGCLRSREDRLRHDIIENLMCYFEADIEGLCERYRMPVDTVRGALDSFGDLERDGCVRRQDTHIFVTDKGKMLIRVICARFDAYLKEEENRHVRAV